MEPTDITSLLTWCNGKHTLAHGRDNLNFLYVHFSQNLSVSGLVVLTWISYYISFYYISYVISYYISYCKMVISGSYMSSTFISWYSSIKKSFPFSTVVCLYLNTHTHIHTYTHAHTLWLHLVPPFHRILPHLPLSYSVNPVHQ